MYKKTRTLFLTTAILGLSACTHSVHMVNVSGFQPYQYKKAGRVIKAMASRKVILSFGGNTDYVERALANLKSQCKGGKIVAITTEMMTSHNFLSYEDKIYLKGRCI